ncbi:hypothetical protein NMG60_11001041 [Bertholletia excelsa]
MATFARNLVEKLDNKLPPLVEPPTSPAVELTDRCHSRHGSIETLVAVLAVITIAGVIAGIIARLCGGRHGQHDIEGWVERSCRSCIDAGVPSAPQPTETKPATEEAKK